MTRETKTTIKGLLICLLFLALAAFGGHYDYRDTVRVEMLDNGSYTRLAEAYPDATEGELIDLYLRERP